MKRMCGWRMTGGWLADALLVGLTGCKPSEAVKQGQVIGKGAAEPEALRFDCSAGSGDAGDGERDGALCREGSGAGEDRHEHGSGVLDDGWG